MRVACLRALPLLAAMLYSVETGHADEPAGTPGHLVYPVKTALNREMAGSVDVVVLLDTTKALKRNVVSFEHIDRKTLARDLRPYLAKKDAKLHFNLFFPRNGAVDSEREVVLLAMVGFGHKEGFAKTTAHGTYLPTDAGWEEYIAPFTGKARQPRGDIVTLP
jgi:hypothetical protein